MSVHIRQFVNQDRAELAALLEFIKPLDIKSYLEIGSRRGDSLYAICSATGCYALSIDLPDPGHDDIAADLKETVEHFGVERFIGESRSEEAIALAAARAPFDLVFIDGDHTYDAVRADWLNYGPMGKVVVFHDIEHDDDPRRLWLEIRDGFQYKEFITPGSRMGFGVLIR